MNKLRIASQVPEDLSDIVEYVTERGSRKAAVKLYREIYSKFQLLRRFPESGRLRDDLAPGLRGAVFL
jgi:plasmid stabilization system protein ParE